ncbi:MAG: ACP phosphodiesterase [Bacteroidota bacterium]|nr:ACP phosphodiesterase [Bacteroidota bacterium]
MNFLAHVALAFPDPNFVAGNFLADLIQKKDDQLLPNSILSGVIMHRWIDHYSNNHESLRIINKLFQPAVRKYAPVAGDIICDYFLFKNWTQYYPMSYRDFTEKIYHILLEMVPQFPTHTQAITVRMVEAKWLNQYTSLTGINEVMNRMNKKAKFKVDFTTTLPIIEENERVLDENFNRFYKDIQNALGAAFTLQNEAK